VVFADRKIEGVFSSKVTVVENKKRTFGIRHKIEVFFVRKIEVVFDRKIEVDFGDNSMKN
jgi:hypothetical protein